MAQDIRKSKKKVGRAFKLEGYQRPIIVELDPAEPEIIRMHEQGTRTYYRLPVGHVFMQAVRKSVTPR